MHQFIWSYITFGHQVDFSKVYPKADIEPNELMQLMSTFASGGTCFDDALSHCVNVVNSGLPKSDIIFVTDGECGIDENIKKSLLKAKSDLELSIYVILIGNESNGDVFDDLANGIVKITSNDFTEAQKIYSEV